MKCDAARPKGILFEDKNNNGTFDPSVDRYLYTGSGCGGTYEISSPDGRIPLSNARFIELETKENYAVFYQKTTSGHCHLTNVEKGEYKPKNLS